MYPGANTVQIKDHDALDKNFKECMNLLHINKYLCQPKVDYINERRRTFLFLVRDILVLERLKEKKKSWREVGLFLLSLHSWILVIPDIDVTPAFDWNYLFFYRVKTNVMDTLTLSSETDSRDSGIGARQFVDVCNQSAIVVLGRACHS